MPTRKPCEYCDGTGLRYGPGFTYRIEASIDRIEAALAKGDEESLREVLGVKPRVPKEEPKSWWHFLMKPKKRKRETAPEEPPLRPEALRVLAQQRRELYRLEGEQGPCYECHGKGYLLREPALRDILGRR